MDINDNQKHVTGIEEATEAEVNKSKDITTEDTKGKTKQKPKRKVVTIGAIALGLCIFIVLLITFIIPTIKYYTALNLLEDDKYIDAIEKFSHLSDFRDSKTMIQECSYQEANDLLALGSYDDASEKFIEIGEFKDSQDMIYECKFQKAHNFLEMDSFDEAIELYTELGEYSYSSKMIKECNYEKAFSLLEEDSYFKSRKLFKSLEDYKRSETMVNEVTYAKGRDSMKREEYDIAISAFRSLKTIEFKDASELLTKAHHTKGVSLYNEENLIGAYTAFSEIPEYLDTSQKLDDLEVEIYNLAVKQYKYKTEKDVKYAKSLFEAIETYKDSEKYLTLILATQCNDSDVAYQKERTYDGYEIYTNLIVLLDFENTPDILMGDTWISYYLEGYWTNGNAYFSLYEYEENVEYNKGKILKYFNTITNIPMNQGKYYDIRSGVFYLGSDEDGWEKQFSFDYVNYNTIKVYCYKNKTTYTLNRYIDN